MKREFGDQGWEGTRERSGGKEERGQGKKGGGRRRTDGVDNVGGSERSAGPETLTSSQTGGFQEHEVLRLVHNLPAFSIRLEQRLRTHLHFQHLLRSTIEREILYLYNVKCKM